MTDLSLACSLIYFLHKGRTGFKQCVVYWVDCKYAIDHSSSTDTLIDLLILYTVSTGRQFNAFGLYGFNLLLFTLGLMTRPVVSSLEHSCSTHLAVQSNKPCFGDNGKLRPLVWLIYVPDILVGLFIKGKFHLHWDIRRFFQTFVRSSPSETSVTDQTMTLSVFELCLCSVRGYSSCIRLWAHTVILWQA